MTTVTNNGETWLRDMSLGTVSAPIDTVVIGSGTDRESTEDTSLGQIEHRTTTENNNVSLVADPNDPRRVIVSVTISAGNEVPAGTEITEMGLIVSELGGEGGLLVARDVSEGTTITPGTIYRTSMPYVVRRER